MSLADDEVEQILGRLPPIIEPTEAARSEAAQLVKRGLTAEQDAGTERAALTCYRDALQLDPACKAAYEALGKLLLGQGARGKLAAEACVRYFEVAKKSLPNDAPIQDMAKRIRGLVSPGAVIEPAIAKGTGRLKPSKTDSNRAAAPGPREKCPYCGSPIPLGSEKCKSCQLSGEIKKPDLIQMLKVRKKRTFSKWLLLFLLATFVAVATLLAWKIVGRYR